MNKDIIQTTIDLVKIPSVSGNEEQIAKALDYCHNFFASDKVYIQRFCYPQASPVMLIANTTGHDFDVMSVGHLDVVPAKDNMFEPQIIGNHLYARGAGDMKAQIAVQLHLMKHIVKNNLNIKFAILITTDEETTSNGIKALTKNQNIRAKIITDTDAGDLYTIIEKYKHSVGVKLVAKGKNAHSSRPWDGINAINEIMQVIKKLEKDFPYFSNQSNEPQDTWIDTMTITAINSPQTTNVVPDKAEATINFRLTQKTTLEQLSNILTKACCNTNCNFEVFMASSGCYMDYNHPTIQSYIKIAQKILPQKISINHMNGATDARAFSDNSIIIMHSINAYNPHGDNEYIDIDSIDYFFEIQKEFINSLL